MSSKPRKAFDGVGRPKGFIDDTAKAALKAVKGAASRYSVMRGPLRRNVKDSIKGAAKKDNVVLNMYSNQYKKSRMTADQKLASRERDENIRANFYRVEGAPRIPKKGKR